MTSPQDWRGHPDWAPGLDASRPAPLLFRGWRSFSGGQHFQGDTKLGIMITVGGEKALQKMRKNRVGWRIEELQAVAEENFVEWRRPGRGGSHVIFSAPGVREIVSVPAKRPIKPVYIKQFVALIDAAGGIRTK